MAWHHTPAVVPVKVRTAEEILKLEGNWVSSYNELERWIKDLKVSHYKLIGEYEVDKKLKLYRFELDETFRKDLVEGAPHFQNVLIDTSLPPTKLGNTFEEKK